MLEMLEEMDKNIDNLNKHYYVPTDFNAHANASRGSSETPDDTYKHKMNFFR